MTAAAAVAALSESKALRPEVNEQLLLHGTSPDVLFSLLSNGLNERFSGTNAGTKFGDGIYFAEDVGKSDQYVSPGGDGWLYSFDARGDAEPSSSGPGRAKLLWQFDCNPKESKYTLGGRADRNHIIGTPVVHDGLVYIAVGEDPEHGEGIGHLWCIDPTKRGDTSPELAVSLKAPDTPLPHRRNQAVIKEQGEVARPNPNSAAIWHYPGFDADGNGKLDFEETMHRTCGTVAIKDGLLFVADFSGLFHCLDLKTGKPHWTHDMLAASWGSPLIADGKVYIGDEDGDISIFTLAKGQPATEAGITSRRESSSCSAMPLRTGTCAFTEDMARKASSIAAITRGCACPMSTLMSCELKSRMRCPSGVYRYTPSARAMGSGLTASFAVHG
jgi:outer membrane protein assembly factor BamB